MAQVAGFFLFLPFFALYAWPEESFWEAFIARIFFMPFSLAIWFVVGLPIMGCICVMGWHKYLKRMIFLGAASGAFAGRLVLPYGIFPYSSHMVLSAIHGVTSGICLFILMRWWKVLEMDEEDSHVLE